jgi:hypothetical protein
MAGLTTVPKEPLTREIAWGTIKDRKIDAMKKGY